MAIRQHKWYNKILKKLTVGIFLFPDGWLHGKSYRFNIKHHPDDGLINLKLWEGSTLIADSGDIIDNGEGSLRGGRMGVFCNSQQSITWSALSYR